MKRIEFAMFAMLALIISDMGVLSGLPVEDKELNSHKSRHLMANDSTVAEPEKSFFDKVKEFYDDKNNFAMYLVLPIIVIVYGGCSLIYCIAKCRRYIKRKKHPKPLAEIADEDEEETTDTRGNAEEGSQNNHVNNSSNSNSNRNGNVAAAAFVASNRPESKARSASDVRVDELDRNQDSTPLPWQVPDDKEALYPTKKNVGNTNHANQKSFDNPAFHDHQDNRNRRDHVKSRNDNLKSRAEHHGTDQGHKQQSRGSPQQRHAQQLSPPPPYEDHGAEFIPLGVAGTSVQRREKPAQNGVGSQQQPRARDPSRARNAMESYNMAKQAAELLRLDEQARNGGRGFKKPKRLVFVAE